MDIVDVLREAAANVRKGMAYYVEISPDEAEQAAAEIVHLRSLAGAVSPGPTAAETLAPLRHKAPDGEAA